MSLAAFGTSRNKLSEEGFRLQEGFSELISVLAKTLMFIFFTTRLYKNVKIIGAHSESTDLIMNSFKKIVTKSLKDKISAPIEINHKKLKWI